MPGTYDVTTIKRHSYVASFGETVIAPLAEAPKIETDRKIVESTIYENGGHEAVASHLVKDSATITTALALLADFAAGDDIMAAGRKHALSFTPLAENEATLIFPAAYLQPDSSYVPAMGADHTATLVFKAFPGGNDNKLFTFA